MIQGLHHVTSVAGDPRANADFYTRTLGLRLVKVTVNFDDPGTYHLYYGDGLGTPGTILTSFPYGQALPGKRGNGRAERDHPPRPAQHRSTPGSPASPTPTRAPFSASAS